MGWGSWSSSAPVLLLQWGHTEPWTPIPHSLRRPTRPRSYSSGKSLPWIHRGPEQTPRSQKTLSRAGLHGATVRKTYLGVLHHTLNAVEVREVTDRLVVVVQHSSHSLKDNTVGEEFIHLCTDRAGWVTDQESYFITPLTKVCFFCFTSSSLRALSHSFWPGACWVHRVISWLMLSVTALEHEERTKNHRLLKINNNKNLHCWNDLQTVAIVQQFQWFTVTLIILFIF